MFNFTLQNPFSFLIAFIPALLNFALVIYILFALPKNRITNIFALLTLCCALWQLGDSVLRITSTAEQADFWDSVFCITWIFIGSLCLHFALLYTQSIKQEYSRFYVPFLYAPGFLFYAFYEVHYYPHIFQPIAFWGWGNFHNQNLIDIAQVYWISILVILTLVLLIIYTFSIKHDKRLKQQSLLITVGLGIPAITGIITQVLFPTIFHIAPMPLTSTLMTCLSIATVVALRKYKLFGVSDLLNSETLIDSIPLLVFSTTTEKRITYVNKFGMRTLGINKKDFSHINFNSLFIYEDEKDEEAIDAVWKRTIESCKSENVESALNTPQGKMDIILSSSPIVNNNQVQGALFTARDITELKRSYQTIRTSESMLQEAQKLSHIGSWEWDVQRDIVTWSDELYRIFGYEPAEIPIKYETYLDRIHSDDREFVNNIIQKAYRDHERFNFYHRVLRNEGDEVIVYARGEVSIDKNNKVIRMNGTAQDVTESKRKEERLRQQNEELQKINSELDKFVYSVSHDLRSPLTSMLGVVEISEEETDDARMHERLNLLKTNIKKLDEFILNILDHSRNARMEIKNEEINFHEIVNDVAENLKYGSVANACAVDIQTSITCDGSFYSDKRRISIVLNNLVSNAIRYANPCVHKSFVEIKISVNSEAANIIVEDNGIGIDEAYHDKIFEMFYRVSQNSIGSGLGLYLVKESIKKLNGKIKVESEKGKGSAFCVCIPNNQIN